MEESKICIKCKEEKLLSEFNKSYVYNNKICFRSDCKQCAKEYGKIYREINKEKIKGYHSEYREINKEKINEFHKEYYKNNKEKINEKNKEYNEKNKEKLSEYMREYHINNKEKIKEYVEINKEKIKGYQEKYRIDNKEKRKVYEKENYSKNKEKLLTKNKKWVETNKEQVRKYHREYKKERSLNDELFKLTLNISSLIRVSIKNNGFRKNSQTKQILGCSIVEFKLYLESKFENWMKWDNYGNWNGSPKEINVSWDIDHIIPISTAICEADIIKLNHYSNLQPLCSYTNRYIKRDNVIF